MNLERSINNISKRLGLVEGYNRTTEEAETDEEIEARFAILREARAKKTNAFGGKTYEDVWDNISQEELDYYKRKNLEVPPEKRYQDRKEHWYFHESSWYMRGLNGYDGYGCNNGVCVQECRYYPEIGRIEDEEASSRYQNNNKIQSEAPGS